MKPESTTDQELWSRLLQFTFDEPGIPLPFSRRLARENGWGERYTMRVLEEYRRFIFLAMTTSHPVTPSVDVDQAWHLHLTYTRSYWDDLCPNVLRGPLHHQPTKGGGKEGAKFQDWYARTLESYHAAFGVAPPADIWPPPSVRLAAESRIRQVSDRTHWVVRKPKAGVVGLVVAVALLGLMITGCEGGDIPGTILPIALVAGLVIVVVIWVISKAQSHHGNQRNNNSDTGAGCSSHSSDSSDSDSGDSDGGSSDGGDSGCSGCGGCGGD